MVFAGMGCCMGRCVFADGTFLVGGNSVNAFAVSHTGLSDAGFCAAVPGASDGGASFRAAGKAAGGLY